MTAVGNYLQGPCLWETHQQLMNAYLASCLLLFKII